MRQLILTLLLTLGFVGPASASIIINEIMQDPAAVSDDDGEWFELFNSGSTAVDINGWIIRDNDIDSHTIDNGGALLIAAGGFLVLGTNGDTSANGGVSLDYIYDRNDLAIANGGDEMILLDNMSIEIDRVVYDGGPSFPDPNGASMALLDPFSDNNVGSNWTTSTASFGSGDLGTPGACNSDVGQQCVTRVPAPTTLLLLVAGLVAIRCAHPRETVSPV